MQDLYTCKEIKVHVISNGLKQSESQTNEITRSQCRFQIKQKTVNIIILLNKHKKYLNYAAEDKLNSNVFNSTYKTQLLCTIYINEMRLILSLSDCPCDNLNTFVFLDVLTKPHSSDVLTESYRVTLLSYPISNAYLPKLSLTGTQLGLVRISKKLKELKMSPSPFIMFEIDQRCLKYYKNIEFI